MRLSTVNYIKDILGDYMKIDLYIKQREEELRNPYYERDINHGIRGTSTDYDYASTMMITIEQDRRLASLERNKRIISDVLEMSNEDTVTIIKELYFKKRPQYTMQGLINEGLIFCSRRKAFDLKNEFFEEIADMLNLEI